MPRQKQDQVTKFKNFVNQWYAFIDYMNKEDWVHLIPTFLKFTNEIDFLRNENCLDVFPELEPIFKLRS